MPDFLNGRVDAIARPDFIVTFNKASNLEDLLTRISVVTPRCFAFGFDQ